jgi:hypothetical protein
MTPGNPPQSAVATHRRCSRIPSASRPQITRSTTANVGCDESLHAGRLRFGSIIFFAVQTQIASQPKSLSGLGDLKIFKRDHYWKPQISQIKQNENSSYSSSAKSA